MPCRSKGLSHPKRPEPKQLCLPLGDSGNRPSVVSATPAILEPLAELLLMVANKMAEARKMMHAMITVEHLATVRLFMSVG